MYASSYKWGINLLDTTSLYF